MIDRPDILYHGSCQGIDGALTPRAQTGDCNGEFRDGARELVFATHDHKMVALYALKTDDMLGVANPETQGGIYSATFQHHDQWQAEVQNAACTIYHLPAQNFTNTISAHHGKPSGEWLSTEAVMPVHQKRVTPQDVMQGGGQLFFLNDALDKSAWHLDKEKPADATFLNRLTAKREAGILPDHTSLQLNKVLMDAGLMTHLNQETGMNPVALENNPALEHAIADDIAWLKEVKMLKELGLDAKDKPALDAAKEAFQRLGGAPGDAKTVTPPPSSRSAEASSPERNERH